MSTQASGWGIVIGFGAFFAIFAGSLVYLDIAFSGEEYNSEHFNTAGRTIKTGLIAVDIVSHWTWAATLLQSCNVAYKYGISGPFWYAAGATIQILLFGILAIEIKRKAPTAHTMLEIIRARWGTLAHIVFFCFALITNLLVSALLVLGGSAVITAVTGMNVYAASMLIPISVLLYTASGGLKATFTTSYAHTVIIYVALCLFTFTVYAGSKDLGIGSIDKVWEHLNIMAVRRPIAGNMNGSALTMFSSSGLVFGVLQVVSAFGTVFVDQAYWQSAIAARPSASVRGYLLGGLLWFSIPFTLATSIGLAGIALDLPITTSESNAGLTPPAVAYALLGKGGAVLIVIIAVTSSGSAEQIAVSSLMTYDLYGTYINPRASAKQLIAVSRTVVVLYGLVMGALSCIFNAAGIDLNWLFLLMGIMIGPAVPPVTFCLTWNRATRAGAVSGALSGFACGIISWLACAKIAYGAITVETTGQNDPLLTGTLCSICISALVCTAVSLIWPGAPYDYKSMKEIHMAEGDPKAGITEVGIDSPEGIEKARKVVYTWGTILSVILIPIWPLLALAAGVFPRGYFYWWVIVSMVWGLIAACIAIVLPVWEARETIWHIIVHLVTCQAATPLGASLRKIVKPDASGDPDALEKGEAKAAPATARPIQRDDTAHGSLAARTAMTKAPEE
ncbi:g1369 [Coccomyxa viridis]|uniref:G1369 protein n=1 Tax=Coccomyxa viridis TaxID=1274662 RepID=A0ABP1FPP3_9CHLO